MNKKIKKGINEVLPEGYFCYIHGFMRVLLDLKKNNLIIYARAWHFAGTDKQPYVIDMKDLILWTGANKTTIYRSISYLTKNVYLIDKTTFSNPEITDNLLYYTSERKKALMVNFKLLEKLKIETDDINGINQFISIPSYARSLLDLSNSKLLLYSIIYQYSIADSQKLEIYEPYLMRMIGQSQRNLQRLIKELTEPNQEGIKLVFKQGNTLRVNLNYLTQLANKIKKQKAREIADNLEEKNDKKHRMENNRKAFKKSVKTKEINAQISNDDPDWLAEYTENILAQSF